MDHPRPRVRGPAGDRGLVQGTAPQDLPHTRQISTQLPPGFGDGAPQEIEVPPGVVTLMIKRIGEEYAPVATEGITVTWPKR